MKERLIFHVDVNSAFLSWEAVYQLKNGASTEIYEQSRQSLAEILPYEKVLSLPNLFLPNILASTQENLLPMH